MTTYQLRIVPAEHDPRVLPFPQISLSCTFTDCGQVFVLPSPTLYADIALPRITEIGDYAALEGWSTHPDTGGDLCPEHPYGTPVAALESHEAVQVRTDTAAIPVAEIQAALAEEDTNDE